MVDQTKISSTVSHVYMVSLGRLSKGEWVGALKDHKGRKKKGEKVWGSFDPDSSYWVGNTEKCGTGHSLDCWIDRLRV